METRVSRLSSARPSLKEQHVRDTRRPPLRPGMIVGCASEPLALRAFDKAQTLLLAEACGVEIPPTRYPASLEECRAAADAVGYPCIVNPRFTAAWNGTGLIPDPGLCYVAGAAELDHA